MRKLSDFGRGLRHGLRGARIVLATPRLWPLVLLPFVLSLAGLAAAVTGALLLRERWLAWFPDAGPLRAVVGVVANLVLVVLAYFAFLPLASLFAAPFNEAIAEAVERRLSRSEPTPFSPARLLADLARSLAHETRKLARYLVLAAGVLGLSLLPVIGPPLALVGGAWLAARFAAYDALDATLSRWGWSYRRKQGFLRERRALSMGLGAFVAALLLVPVVNALAMPLGAAAGASLALEVVPAAERHA